MVEILKSNELQSLKLIPSHYINLYNRLNKSLVEMQPICDNILNITGGSLSLINKENNNNKNDNNNNNNINNNHNNNIINQQMENNNHIIVNNNNQLEWGNLTDFQSAAAAAAAMVSTQNVHCLEHAPQLTYSAYIKAIILAVMAGLSLLANTATIYSIHKNRRKRQSCTAIYTLILHLSIADLLVTIFCIGGEALWSYTVAWIWGNIACKIFKFLQMWSLYLSTFILVLIGVDRFVAVRYPMKSLNTAQRCSRLVLFTWLLSFVLSIPQLIIFHVASGPFVEEFWQCVTHGFYTEPWQEQLYTTLSLIFMFLLPLVILIGTYVSTVVTIARSERMFKTELANNTNHISGDVNRRRLMHRAKTKSLRISVVIVAAFVLWWTPYYTMMIIFMFLNPDKHMSQDLQSGIFFFGMSNSLVNPLIYGAFHLWPQRRRRQGSHWRDGSTMQHNRSTTTNASFMLLPRGSSSRLIVKQTTRNSNLGLNINNRNSQTTDETLLVHLIQDEIQQTATSTVNINNKNNNLNKSTKNNESIQRSIIHPPPQPRIATAIVKYKYNNSNKSDNDNDNDNINDSIILKNIRKDIIKKDEN